MRELARLREFPEISREELFRFFTLSPAALKAADRVIAERPLTSRR